MRAARLHGWVKDLVWFDGDRRPGDYIIVQIGASHYHLLWDTPDNPNIWQKLTHDPSELASQLCGGNLFLEAPLLTGAIFGDFDKTSRAQYCSVVLDEHPFNRRGIHGVRSERVRKEFNIRYWTNPDDSVTSFVPGLGVTEYVYRHHGTTANCDVKLVEVYLPKASR